MSDSNRAYATYLNPVYPRSFPDPFVLKFQDIYYGYCTGHADDGNVFGILRSRDLVTWEKIGGAMRPLAPSPPFYWAPEVNYDNGKFYLYYSAGPETVMEVRVAVSDRPDGGFVDSGHRLTQEDFAIDAHVFIDEDGSKYLFYATDFLDHTHIGTGTVVDRMIDWVTLAGEPRPVTRAKYDWQVYDPNRKEKGGVRWHTVEGPTVLKRKGIYYEMFSGGNWQNTTYGVSFAISERIDNPDEWRQFSDGESALPILRTDPDVIVGPGHNSVVRGPNNRELYCVYHRWTDAGRVLAIDRMDFAGTRIFIVGGATNTPQPAPFSPTIDRIGEDDPRWSRKGKWTFNDGRLVGSGELTLDSLPDGFLLEVSFRYEAELAADGNLRIGLTTDRGSVTLTFHPTRSLVEINGPDGSTKLPTTARLPVEFDWSTDHLLRIEADHRKLKIKLDVATLNLNTVLSSPVRALSIGSERQSIIISSFQLTEGFEELFEDTNSLDDGGWQIGAGDESHVHQGEALFETAADHLLYKNWRHESFEFATNFRFLDGFGLSGSIGVVLRDAGDKEVFRLIVDRAVGAVLVNQSTHPLPSELVLSEHHQLRILKLEGSALCYFDDVSLGEFDIPASELLPVIVGRGAPFAVEMVRVTVV
jgi:GH43 family beta-xylosidase